MYTRRRRPAFAPLALLVIAGLPLAACHSAGGNAPRPARAATQVDVGYETQDARDVNTAVSSASGEKLRANSPRTVADMLVARFPGVEVKQFSNGSTSIRIRGTRSLRSNEEPLIVLDGTPQHNGNQTLKDLTPQDIVSIEVLRDAAATSTYGSRGSNGVILISTRRNY